MSGSLRLADLLAALSVTTDLAMGQKPEKAIRAAVLAVEIGRRLNLPDGEVADVYYTTLLRHLGCTATTHEESTLFGPDEVGIRAVIEHIDERNPRELLAFLGMMGHGAGIGGRVAHIARTAVGGSRAVAPILRAVCEVGAQMAARLGLGAAVERGLADSLERWDGKGAPRKLAGDDIPVAARIAEPATQAVIFHRIGGADAVVAMAERRSGGWFDPAVAQAVRDVGPDVLARLEATDPWEAVLDAEPEPVRRVEPDRVGRVAEAFADMVDLKSPFTLGHSAEVAELATVAAGNLGLDADSVRVAALLHDLGRAGVSTGLWDKPGPLSRSEWEAVRLHPYHSERILARSEVLEPVSRIAGMHHERQDGSGYHRGAMAHEASAAARVVAVADAYQAMTQDRAHRPARSAPQAAEIIEQEASAGRFDPECARAVLEAAGRTPSRARGAWPADLSDREVEVLRLVSRGLSNKQIAGRLVISPRTAEHHVQHIYAKIGASTRAAAAMFAMQQGLLRD